MSLVNILSFIVIYNLCWCLCSIPVVLWHGLGDDHLESIKQIIRENVGDKVYIKSIQMGVDSIQDTESGIFVHPNDQIQAVCLEVTADDNLSNGFHAIGFSQGAQFL